MKRIALLSALLLLMILPAIHSCKKDAPAVHEVYKTFDLGFTWVSKPQTLITQASELVMGFADEGGDSTKSFRLVAMTSEGSVLKNTRMLHTDIFPSFTTVYPNMELTYANGTLYLNALAKRSANNQNSFYVLTAEFNSSFNVTRIIERKIMIGGLEVSEASAHFMTPYKGGFLFTASCTELNGDPVVYQEITDGNLYSLKYWKKQDLIVYTMAAFGDYYYLYAAANASSAPSLLAYDASGTQQWQHKMSFTTQANTLSQIKTPRLSCTSSGLMFSFASASNTSIPVVSYLVGFDGSKQNEQALSFSGQNFLNFSANHANHIFYAGQTCSAPGACKPYWAKYDENLNLLFSKSLPDNFSKNMNALYVNESSTGYTLIGLKDDFSSKIPDGFILKTDLTGAIAN